MEDIIQSLQKEHHPLKVFKCDTVEAYNKKVINAYAGAHDGKKGVRVRNAHALMSFSVSYLFPADIIFLEQQNGRFVAQILVRRLFLGLLYMPYRSLRDATRPFQYLYACWKLLKCCKARVRALLIWHRKVHNKNEAL